MSFHVLNVIDAPFISDMFLGNPRMLSIPMVQFTVVSAEIIGPAVGVTVQPANAPLLAVIRMPADVSDKATIWLRM